MRRFPAGRVHWANGIGAVPPGAMSEEKDSGDGPISPYAGQTPDRFRALSLSLILPGQHRRIRGDKAPPSSGSTLERKRIFISVRVVAPRSTPGFPTNAFLF